MFDPGIPRALVHAEVAEVNRSSESEERYVEAINNIARERGYARVADLATTLDVKPPSVTSMLQKLDEQRFVNYTKYRGVLLTSKGKSLAGILARRHQTLKRFLTMMGISGKNAEKDACKIKHKIDGETIERFDEFVEFVESAPQTPPFLKHFEHYCRTGKRPKHCRVEDQAKNSQVYVRASTRRHNTTNNF